MAVKIGTSNIKSAYVGTTAVKSIYVGTTKVRPTQRTFTIVWTETSNPASFFVRYEDDAAGLTQGSTAFDEFFGYSAVKLSSNGTETATLAQTSAGVLPITQLGTLTSGDNVMIKFPVRGIKMTKSGSTITLSITDAVGRESEGYQYYAFQKTGNITANASSTVATNPLYIGAYQSCISSSTMKSWSNNSQYETTLANHLTYSAKNGTNWTIMGWYQWNLINAYYMMKYGNPNSQAIVGQGLVNAQYGWQTGRTNSQTNATYGVTSSGSESMKLFGIEDWWGHHYSFLGGVFTNAQDSSTKACKLFVALHDFTTNTGTGQSQYIQAGSIKGVSQAPSYMPWITTVVGDNKCMFGGSESNGSASTYYCDRSMIGSYSFPCIGGNKSSNTQSGAFYLETFSASTSRCSRLMYI